MSELDARCLAVAREIVYHNRHAYDLSLGASLREDPHDLRELVADLEELDELDVEAEEDHANWAAREDLYAGDLYLGWLCMVQHGKRRGWWFIQPAGAPCEVIEERDAAVKALETARGVQ